MLLDIALLALLLAGVAGASLFLARGGRRPLRTGLERLAERRGWRLTDLPGHSTGRIALSLTPAEGADWSVTLHESPRRSPGRSDIRHTIAARFHSPRPAWPEGWLAVLPPLPGGAAANTMLGLVSAGRLTPETIETQRLASLLPETALATPPRPLSLPGNRPAYLLGAADTPPPGLDHIVAALAPEGAKARPISLALGPEGLTLTLGMPVHPLDPAAPVLEDLIDRALTLRAALLSR